MDYPICVLLCMDSLIGGGNSKGYYLLERKVHGKLGENDAIYTFTRIMLGSGWLAQDGVVCKDTNPRLCLEPDTPDRLPLAGFSLPERKLTRPLRQC